MFHKYNGLCSWNLDNAVVSLLVGTYKDAHCDLIEHRAMLGMLILFIVE